ncbi:MAG: tetracycline resistance MFS efflux pump [Anaerolineales bacterium]
MNPSLIFIALALFTWGIGEGMYFYFVPIYLEQLGASPLQIGSIFSAFGFMMLIAHAPSGYLSDKWGRRQLLRLNWVVGLLATVIMAASPSLWLFVAGYWMYGLTASVTSPLFSYVTAARGKMTAGRAMTLISAVFSLGMIFGPSTGGWIGETYGLRTIFMAAIAVFSVSLVFMLFLRPQPRDEFAEHEKSASLFANPRYLTMVGIIFVTTFAMFLPQPLTPNFLKGERGLTIAQMGWVGTVGSAGNFALNLLLGSLNARLGFVLGQALTGLFALTIWKGTGVPFYMLAYFLLGGFRAARMLAFAQVRALIHQAQMGLAYGIVETLGSLAMILAPLLAGYLYDTDPASIYPLSLLLILGAIVVSLAFSPKEQLQKEEVSL